MSIVTKSIAKEVADSLTLKKLEFINVKEQELRDVFTEMYVASLPNGVFELFNIYPSYFKQADDKQLSGNGFQWEWFKLNRYLPSENRGFEPSIEQAKKLRKLKDLIDDKTKEFKQLRSEIERTLLNLKTYKKVGEFLPEAIPFLPEKITTALSIDVTDLRNRLK